MTTPILSVNDYIISTVAVEHEYPVFYNETVSFKSTAYDRGLHRLKIKLDVWLESQEDIKKFEAFVLTCKGRLNPFFLDLGDSADWLNPFTSKARSVSLSAPTVIGQSSIPLSGGYSNISPGDKFTLDNETKVYTVISRDTATVEIVPALRYAHPSADKLNFQNPRPLVRFNKDLINFEYDKANKVSIELVEVQS